MNLFLKIVTDVVCRTIIEGKGFIVFASELILILTGSVTGIVLVCYLILKAQSCDDGVQTIGQTTSVQRSRLIGWPLGRW